ncbi:MAG: carboxymuconolactone decarboxylase family protein [Acidimicrobiia bacterium]
MPPVPVTTWAPQADDGGTVLDRVVNHRPDYADAMRSVDAAIWSQRALDLGVLELCRLRIAQLLGAPHGVDNVRSEARPYVTDEQITRLSQWPDDPVFTADQRACLAHAEQLLIDATGVDDASAATVMAAVGHDGFVVLSYACGFFETTTRAALVVEGRQ